MKCTACGNENQPGAKFCVHCGVVLSLTAPASAIAPVASAPPASTSTGQRPALTPQSTAPAAAQTAARPASPVAPPPAAPAPAAAAPAQTPVPLSAQTSSRTLGLAIAGIALLIVLGVGGYFGYRMLAGDGSRQVTAAVEPPKTDAQTAAPAAEPAKDAATQETPAGGGTSTGSSPASAAPGQAPVGAPAAPASASPPLPGQPATTPEGTPGKMSVAKTPPKSAPAQPVQTPPRAAPPASAASAPAPSKAPAKTVTAQADRWQMYADEMANCAKEDFFSRLGCQQRTRARYCEGYWGKVPQCPATPPADHGQ